MKKKQILAMGLSAALLCAGSAFAAEAETAKVENTKPVDEKTSEATETQEAQLNVRMGEMVSVTSIQENSGVDDFMLVKTAEGQEIQLNLGAQTLVVNNETGVPATLKDIKAGDKVFAYYSPAMTRSLPPQSACELILVNVGDKTPASLHEVGTVAKEESGKRAITTLAGDMIIRVDDKTAMSDLKTKNIVTSDDLVEGTRFLAWYDVVAMSYPGQAYTEKLIVLPALPTVEETADAEATNEAVTAKEKTEQKMEELTPAKEAEKAEEPKAEEKTEQKMEELTPAKEAQKAEEPKAEEKTEQKMEELTPAKEAEKPEDKPAQETELTVSAGGKILASKASVKDGKAVIAVREAAEALGCKVSYEQKDGKEFVTIENDTRKMTLEIGQDLYVSASNKDGVVGMTSPEKYGIAPYIVEDRTYAPADLFKALVGFEVEVKDGTVTISAKK